MSASNDSRNVDSVRSRRSQKPLPGRNRWRLWVDGCGGYLLLSGVEWTVGGISPVDQSNIVVAADWPRNAGKISRREDQYVWQANTKNGCGESQAKAMPIEPGKTIPVGGSANLVLVQPSPLSPTAVLKVDPPHRFSEHVDGVILVDQTILVGPTADCHARSAMLTGKVLLVCRGESWFAKAVGDSSFVAVPLGTRIVLAEVGMTLEK